MEGEKEELDLLCYSNASAAGARGPRRRLRESRQRSVVGGGLRHSGSEKKKGRGGRLTPNREVESCGFEMQASSIWIYESGDDSLG